MTKKPTKKELIKTLVDKYGYESEDIKMLTNGKLETMIKQEEEDAKELEISSTIEPSKNSRDIKDDDMITVMSGVKGTLIHRSERTGRTWRFTKFGQTDKMPYIELITIYNNSSKVFDNGSLIVLNEQVAENFRLTEINKKIVRPENLDNLFKEDLESLKRTVSEMPKSMKVIFFARAKQLYEKGEIDSVKMVDYIEKTFDTSFKDNASPSEDGISFSNVKFGE